MRPFRRLACATLAVVPCAVAFLATHAGVGVAQTGAGASVVGRVLAAATGAPLRGALVAVEDSDVRVLSDSLGQFRLGEVSAGPHVLRVELLGYATARVAIMVPSAGAVRQDVRLAVSALQIEGLIVTADPTGRARGESGTATVIEREAIRHYSAASLAGLLELVPGVPVRPPGLDGLQQISLRSVPISSTADEALGAGHAALASAGTLIVLDGIPLSNNANLQTLGPRGELTFGSSAGGGIDLRRMPAALIDRVDVIRGVPSARYGDLTQGAIIVETRAGAIETDFAVRKDSRTTEASIASGRRLGAADAVTASFDVARTLLAPGMRDDHSYRLAGQLAHRLGRGGEMGGEDRLLLDTRLDFYQLLQDTPERPEVSPGSAARNRDSGLRVSERLRLRTMRGVTLEVSTAIDRQRQRSSREALRQRGALPFTDRLTDGRATGRFIGGSYRSRVDVDGDPWLVFTRIEASRRSSRPGTSLELRAGAELRREWNSGPGYQFDMEFPPQVTFTGVEGFDRPRRYDAVPALATSALYADSRLYRGIAGGRPLDVQMGLRFDLLHGGTHWATASRHTVVQPRINVQFAPTNRLRVRAGIGRTSKIPTLAQLNPAPEYHDIVNVNWYANDPAERLAVLTTYVLDPTNPELRQPEATKREVGVEVPFGSRGGALTFVAFEDRIRGGIGFRRTPAFLLRDRYQLTDSTFGTGMPPGIIEPATHADTIPIMLLQPSNMLSARTRGYEATLTLPEVPALNTRFELQGAWLWTRLESEGIETGGYFRDFQLDADRVRAPYWDGSTRTGERLILDYRVIHQQPAVGLVITATVQHTPREVTRNIAGTDTLAFAGYITRAGRLVPVAATERSREEYRDLRLPRRAILTDPARTAPDWMLSIQVSKTLPLGGRLSFYAFNALDRVGQYGRPGYRQRLFEPMRFGAEVTVRPGAIVR